MKVGRAGNENKTVGREDGGGSLVVCRGECAVERDANVRVQTRPPHEHQVFSQFVYPAFLCVALLSALCRVEEEFERDAKAFACVEILQLIREQRRFDAGRKPEQCAWEIR